MVNVSTDSTVALCEPCSYPGPSFSVPEYLLCGDGGYPTAYTFDRLRPECMP